MVFEDLIILGQIGIIGLLFFFALFIYMVWRRKQVIELVGTPLSILLALFLALSGVILIFLPEPITTGMGLIMFVFSLMIIDVVLEIDKMDEILNKMGSLIGW